MPQTKKNKNEEITPKTYINDSSECTVTYKKWTIIKLMQQIWKDKIENLENEAKKLFVG